MSHRSNRMRIASKLVPFAATAALMGLTTAANAQSVGLINDYSAAPNGYAYSPGGGTTSTYMMADDITVAASAAGTPVTGMQFSVYNSSASGVSFSASPVVNFYAADGASGGPGTFLGGLTFNPLTTSGGFYTYFNYTNYNSGHGIFTIPASGSFWVGESFIINGGTATAAQLDSLGLALGTPTVGSSADKFFIATAPGTAQASNPTGTIYTSPFGGTPAGNFAFSFGSAPEPSAIALALSGTMLTVGGVIRRRRAAKA